MHKQQSNAVKIWEEMRIGGVAVIHIVPLVERQIDGLLTLPDGTDGKVEELQRCQEYLTTLQNLDCQ